MRLRHPRRLTATPYVLLVSMLLSLGTGGADLAAEPRTMYRPQDIQNARRNIEQHAWARNMVAAWKRNVDHAMQQDRAFFEQLIPDLTPGSHYGQTCPRCVGKQSREGRGRFVWRVTQPDQVTCAAFPAPAIRTWR